MIFIKHASPLNLQIVDWRRQRQRWMLNDKINEWFWMHTQTPFFRITSCLKVKICGYLVTKHSLKVVFFLYDIHVHYQVCYPFWNISWVLIFLLLVCTNRENTGIDQWLGILLSLICLGFILWLVRPHRLHVCWWFFFSLYTSFSHPACAGVWSRVGRIYIMCSQMIIGRHHCTKEK